MHFDHFRLHFVCRYISNAMFVKSWISKPLVQLYLAFFVRNTLGNKQYLKVLYVAAVVGHKAAVVDNLQYVTPNVTPKACHNWRRLQCGPGIGMNLVWLKWYHALRTRGYNSDCIVEHRAVHGRIYSREPCCRVVSLYAMYTHTRTHNVTNVTFNVVGSYCLLINLVEACQVRACCEGSNLLRACCGGSNSLLRKVPFQRQLQCLPQRPVHTMISNEVIFSSISFWTQKRTRRGSPP